MKKMMMAILVFLAVAAGNMSFATGSDPVPMNTKKSLEKSFPGNQFATWKRLDEFGLYIVSFIYNKENIIAYIDDDGSLQATVRRVEKYNLPFFVSDKLSKKYNDFEIVKIEELTMDTETSYLLVLESAKSRVTVRIFSSGDSYEMKKVKKKPVAAEHHS